jgi:hypothetical protein
MPNVETVNGEWRMANGEIRMPNALLHSAFLFVIWHSAFAIDQMSKPDQACE